MTNKLTAQQIYAVARQAGFSPPSAVLATAIAFAESGGDADSHNPVPPDNSYGLWQINMIGTLGPARRKQFGLASNEALFDPYINAKAAYAISSHGSNFGPWTTYTSGAYRANLTKAQKAAAATGDPNNVPIPTNEVPGVTGTPNDPTGSSNPGVQVDASGPKADDWLAGLDRALNPKIDHGLNLLGDTAGALQLITVRAGVAFVGLIFLGTGLLLMFGREIFGGAMLAVPGVGEAAGAAEAATSVVKAKHAATVASRKARGAAAVTREA